MTGTPQPQGIPFPELSEEQLQAGSLLMLRDVHATTEFFRQNPPPKVPPERFKPGATHAALKRHTNSELRQGRMIRFMELLWKRKLVRVVGKRHKDGKPIFHLTEQGRKLLDAVPDESWKDIREVAQRATLLRGEVPASQ